MAAPISGSPKGWTYKTRVNVDAEYFGRREIAKIFSVSVDTVKKWEKEGIIVRTFLPTMGARYHARELSKIGDTVYGEPASSVLEAERENCTCRCKDHRPPSHLDGLREVIERDRSEARGAVHDFSVSKEGSQQGNVHNSLPEKSPYRNSGVTGDSKSRIPAGSTKSEPQRSPYLPRGTYPST